MKKKSLVKNSLYNILRTFVTLVFPLAIYMYASRILGPDGIGAAEFSKNFAGYFVLVASLGINNYGIREGAKRRESRLDFSRFVHEILLINLVSMAVAITAFIAVVFLVPNLQSYRVLLLVFCATIVMTPMGLEWAYGALEEYRYISLRTMGFQALALAATFLLVRKESDIVGYSIVLIISSVGSNILNLIHIWKYVDFKWLGNYNLKQHLPAIMLLFALAISNSLYSYIDTTMLGLMVNDYEVGLYTASLKITRIVVNILGAIGAVVMPRLSYLWANGEREEFNKITRTVLNILLMLAIPSCLGIAALRESVLLIFSGGKYLPAANATMVLSAIIILLSVSTFFNMHILVPINKEKYTLTAILSGLAVHVVLNIFLIPAYGHYGAAYGTVAGEAVVLLIGFAYGRHYVNLEGIGRLLLQYVIAAAPIIPICMCVCRFAGSAILQLGISVIISAAVYAVILIALKNPTAAMATGFISKKLFKKENSKNE